MYTTCNLLYLQQIQSINILCVTKTVDVLIYCIIKYVCTIIDDNYRILKIKRVLRLLSGSVRRDADTHRKFRL